MFDEEKDDLWLADDMKATDYVIIKTSRGFRRISLKALGSRLDFGGSAGGISSTSGSGEQGPRGFTGATGPEGPAGSAGSDGAQGTQGDTGLTGSQGTQGDIGATGFTGPTGLTGPAGSDGAAGSTGLQGDQGIQGDIGLPGNDGNDGVDGAAGTAGTDGAPGVDGNDGATGATGPRGSGQVLDTYCSSGGTGDTGSGQVVPFNTTRLNTDSGLLSLSSNAIVIALARYIKVDWSVTIGMSATAARSDARVYLQLDAGGGYSEITASSGYTYNRQSSTDKTTASGSIMLEVAAGDKIRVVYVRNSGTGTVASEVDGCRFGVTVI